MRDNPNFEVSQVNLSDDHGNPTWHQRYSIADVININTRTDYYTSQREDYNNPIEKGKRFKSEWIRFTETPKNTEWDTLVSYWDLSYTTAGDYKACAIIGAANGVFKVLDVFCRRCDISEAMDWHFMTMKRYAKAGLKALCYYDATAAQKAVYEPIFLQAAAKHKFYEMPMPDLSQRVDKHLRIDATLTNVLFNGTLTFCNSLEGTPDMDAALQQILSFEKGTRLPDDFPDALESGVRKIQLFAVDHSTNEWARPTIVKRSRGGF